MLSKYLKLSFRLMARNPFFTFINVAGLSVGLAVFLVLWQYSQNELKSDQFHKDFERISRLCYFWNFADSNGNPDHSVNSGIDPEVARLIDVDFDEIEDHTRILNQPNMWDGYLKIHGNKLFLVNEGSYDNVSFMESKVVYGDSNLFSFFSLPLVKGDASSVLSEANSIVLSEASAQKYFGDVDPLGKLLLLNGTIPLHVAGVFKDLPANTHLQFEIVISIKTIHRVVSEIAFGRFYCYFKIRKGIDQSSLQKKVNETANALYLPLLERAGFKELPKVELFFQPLKDVAFPKPEYGGIWGDNNWAKSKTLLKTFETVAIVILLMAWINYTNLTIASNRKRVKELGARRAVGAGLPDFMNQFLIDASG